MLDLTLVNDVMRSDDIKKLNLSMFSQADILNTVLQRSEVLYDVERSGRLIRAWSKGDPGPLQHIIETKGEQLLQRAISMLYLEYQALKPTLDKLDLGKVADIGCGYAFIDLFIAQDSEASLVLIDLEQNDVTHFGFHQDGAAYSNLETARSFLTLNGITADRIETLNPRQSDPTDVGDVDVAMSLLSCGFHYPTTTYADFWEKSVKPDGAIILDIRNSRHAVEVAQMERVGYVEVISDGEKHKRILVKKGVLQ